MARRRNATAVPADATDFPPLPLAKPFPAERLKGLLVINQIKPVRRRNVAKLGRDERASLAAIVEHVDALERLLESTTEVVRERAAAVLLRLA